MTEIEDILRAGPRADGPPRFASADVGYAVTDTPVGRLLLAATGTDGAVVTVTFAPDLAAEDRVLGRLADTVSPRVLHRPASVDQVRRQLDEYFDRRRTGFDVALDVSLLTGFQRSVLGTLRERVGYGTHTSYGRLAAWVGQPSAARAVGAALGANPLCIVLPCHRVVSASGALTGYAGGLPAKRRLLALEAGLPAPDDTTQDG